jgi:hypothetical protein
MNSASLLVPAGKPAAEYMNIASNGLTPSTGSLDATGEQTDSSELILRHALI